MITEEQVKDQYEGPRPRGRAACMLCKKMHKLYYKVELCDNETTKTFKNVSTNYYKRMYVCESCWASVAGKEFCFEE